MFTRLQYQVLRLTLLFGLGMLSAYGSATYGMQIDDPGQAASKHIEEFLETASDAGFSAAVWADGKVAWSQQWGLSNKKEHKSVDAKTMFRIGSVTKILAATALCDMVEDKKLTLDDALSDFLPDAPKHFRSITPRQLACHLSGIRHYPDDSRLKQQEFLSQEYYDSHLKAMKIFQSDALKSKPGAEYLYSTYGYTTLGAIMESADSKTFVEIFQERVFAPAGMKHTFCEHNETVTGELAVPYGETLGRVIVFPKVDNSNKLAGGGLVSTPNDLARFMGALVENRMISDKTFELMMQSQQTNSGKNTRVGIGWRIAKDSRGRRLVHHGGAAAGGRAFILLYPDQKVGVALCMNLASHKIKFDEDLALKVVLPFVNR